MNREQGRLFLEGIKKINIKQSPSFNLLSNYNIDNLLILAGCYYLYTKSTSYISNISIYSIIKKIPYVRRYINTKVNDAVKVINNEFKIKDHKSIVSIPEKGLSPTDIKSLELNYKALRKYNYEFPAA